MIKSATRTVAFIFDQAKDLAAPQPSVHALEVAAGMIR
jgi:hypothetical protein